MRNIRTKVMLLALTLVLVPQLATVVAVLTTSSIDVNQRATARVDAGGEVIRSLVDNRVDLITENTIRGADSTELLAAIAYRSDVAGTLESVALDSGASFGVISEANGEASYAAPFNLTDSARTLLGSLISASDNSVKVQTLILGEKGYVVSSAPIQNDTSNRWLSLAYNIDDNFARKLAGLTSLDVTFMLAANGRSRMLGSSLSVEERTRLNTASEQVAEAREYKEAVNDLERDYLIIRRPLLGDASSDVFVILQEPLTAAMAPYAELRTTLLQLVLITFVLALIGGSHLSKSLTRPIRVLASAARRMRIGDYSERVSMKRNDEFGQLAAAFNAMQKGIAKREQMITDQAQHDALTGLPNRSLAMEILTQNLGNADNQDAPVSILVMHLQRFREIQSSLGHEMGDEVLRQSALRLQATLEEGDTLARLEGDQFLMILPNTDREQGEAKANTLIRLMDAGLGIQDVNVTLDAVIGMCVFPEHGRQADQLLRRAAVAKNDAMHEVAQYRIYKNGREARHVRQLAILSDLRRAATEDQLQLHLQPKISLNDGLVCGAEALVRWDHPELGWIAPDEFVPLAENAGNIGLLTRWVLRKSIELCRDWHERGIEMPIAVNLSGQDLLDDNLPYLITSILRDYNMSADCLLLEITEAALVRDMRHAVTVLNCLRDMGARTSMDDFGTGYSSLLQLKSLPVDELKIDRSFVEHLPSDEADAAIVESTISLAHRLGLEVCAEGVETPTALKWLQENGCERAQGYYISRPMPSVEFFAWMEQRHQFVDTHPDDSLILKPQLV